MVCGLSLRITPGDMRCMSYQQSGSDTCRYCELIKSVEVVEMAKNDPTKLKKGDLFDCPGCGKRLKYESNGLCGGCNQKKRLARQAAGLPAGPVTKPAAVYPDLPADVAEVKESFGKVVNAEGDQTSFGVDPMVHMAMRDAWYDAERKALEALSGLSPISALARAHDFVQQIQRLEVQP